MSSDSTINVLIITYYWPPSGGSGVQRWLKFTKYLSSFRIQPVVYVPENADYPVVDKSLTEEISQNIEIWKYPIWEPYQLYKRILGISKDSKLQSGEVSKVKKSYLQQWAVWLRGNLLIPDPRKFWVFPSVKFLKKKMQEKKFSAIISSGPPHSVHLIAEKISSFFNLPWIVDMRDPWTDVFYYKDLKHSFFAKNWDKKLESRVLNKANHIITVSKGLKEIFLSKVENKNKITVITNGYDEEDFSASGKKSFSEFTITYTGQLLHSYNPYPFFDALNNLLQSGLLSTIRLNLIGSMGKEIISYIEKSSLKKVTVITKNLPHLESLSYLKGSHLLFLCVPEPENAKGILTGKIFEYLASGKPILNLCNTSLESEEIIRDCQAGKTFYRHNLQGIKNFILSVYADYKNGKIFTKTDACKKYERKYLTEELGRIIRGIRV